MKTPSDTSPSAPRALSPLGLRGSVLASAAALALVGLAGSSAPSSHERNAHASAPPATQVIAVRHPIFTIPRGSARPDLFDSSNGKRHAGTRRGGTATAKSGPFTISKRSIPADVSRSRFGALARSSARHWGLRVGAWTTTVAGARDRKNVVGFSLDMPDGVLGVQTDWIVTKRGRGSRVVEQDIELTPAVAWEQGPRRPDGQHFDLRTVLLHELGHAGGTKAHEPHCSDSPMVGSLAPGEWWHSSTNWFAYDCPASPSSPLRRASAARRATKAAPPASARTKRL